MLMMYRNYSPGKGNRAFRFVITIVTTYIYCIAGQYALIFIIHDPAYISFLEASIPVRFIFAFLIFSFITILHWFLSLIDQAQEKEDQLKDTEKLMKEAELANLRQQLQPHFLFNSLNSISALVVSKPEQARKMVQQLSDFLRGTLKKDDKQLVNLQEELHHLQLYLEIERVRFGHRLNFEIEQAPDTEQLQLPPLLLQPIVENAIKFGLYDTTEAITIKIGVKKEGNFLYMFVQNPFDPKTQASNKGTGFGLNSVQRRLQLIFARPDLLITEKKDNIFITILKIPQH
jgi:two-component system LytT family sensor kinase